jgi:very-short-patch-repair endonuclease
MRRREEAQRRAFLNAHGIKLLQFPRHCVLHRPDSVRNTIVKEIGA